MASDLLKNDQTCENPEQNDSDNEGEQERRMKWIGHHLSQTHLMEQANRIAWTRKNPEQNPRKDEDTPLQQQKPKLRTALQQQNNSKKSMRKREPCTGLNRK